MPFVHKLFLSFVLLAIASACTSTPIKEDDKLPFKLPLVERYLDISPATLVIKFQGQAIGSAFLYRYEVGDAKVDLIITAAHVIFGLAADKITIENDWLSPIPLVDIIDLRDSDVAVLSIADHKPIETLPILERAEISDLKRYASVISFGFPVFPPDIVDTLLLANGNIQAVVASPALLAITLNPLSKGSSGAPVLLVDSLKLVGLISRQVFDQRQKKEIGVSYVVPINEINRAIRHNYLPLINGGGMQHNSNRTTKKNQ